MNLTFKTGDHAIAMAQFCKRITFEDAYRRADACDGEEHRKEHAQMIIEAFGSLEKCLSNAGYNHR